LNRRHAPVHQNLLMVSHEDARNITRDDIAMAVCNKCGFVFNQTFNPALLEYGSNYDSTQACSPHFSEHLDKLVTYLLSEKGVNESRIVEVGCGDGAFLRQLVAGGTKNQGRGFDPGYGGPLNEFDGKLIFDRCFYGPDCAGISADFVVIRHVLEHVQDPLVLLQTVRKAVDASENGQVFIEMPCVEWILRNGASWNFFYEYCTLFSADSLATAMQISGFNVDKVQHVFGGQYLWVEASPSRTEMVVDYNPEAMLELTRAFSISTKRTLEAKVEEIRLLAAKGKVALWGGGAKGATFANEVDPVGDLIDCVVDINPRKQGYFLPGTGHPIVSYRELPVRGVTDVILMNSNYRDEVLSLLKAAQVCINLVG